MVNFYNAYSHRGGNCNCLLSHTARWFVLVCCHTLGACEGEVIVQGDEGPVCRVAQVVD